MSEIKTQEFRIEHDSMGEVRVPLDATWQAQTQRAVENFPISGQRVAPSLIVALAAIKSEAARVNAELNVLPGDIANALSVAADRVVAGEYADQFPVDVFQTGSGTSTNMNVNEVLASLATSSLDSQVVSPNDHANASQSSNDVFPSAIRVAAAREISVALVPSLQGLALALENKMTEFADVVKAGRTHLMDATPVTLGQEFSGYAAAVRYGIERLHAAMSRLCELPLGGTAVGTGINAPREFAPKVIARLASRFSLPLIEARNHFEAQGTCDALSEMSAVTRTVALSLYKIANDLRWMSSGPRCGLGEIHLPDLQPGSSIMPGKVNPVVPEAVCQVVAQVIGNDAAVAFGASAGNFELNVMLPVVARNLLESIGLLGAVSDLLTKKCIVGITANVEKCEKYALSSPSIGTALNPYIGYEAAARVIKKSLEQEKDLRTVVLEEGLLTPEQVDKALNVQDMTKGGFLR